MEQTILSEKCPTENYLALGRAGKSSWQRYLIGSLIIIIMLLVPQMGLAYVLRMMNGGHRIFIDSATGKWIGVNPTILFIGLGLTFAFWLFGIWLVLRYIHYRRFLSLFTTSSRINKQHIFLGLVAWMSLSIMGALIMWLLFPNSYQFTFKYPDFFYSLIVALLIVPVQSLSEEACFRGYWLQGLSPLVKNTWLLSLTNGILFMIPHLGNHDIAKSPLIMASYYLFIGFIYSAITIRSNGLETAIGAHIGNNLFMAVIANDSDCPIQTNSIFTRTYYLPELELILTIISGLILYWLVTKLPRNSSQTGGLRPPYETVIKAEGNCSENKLSSDSISAS